MVFAPPLQGLVVQREIKFCLRQTEIRAEEYSSIDDHTRPSIDANHASFRGRLVTVKLLEDKLDENNFSQDLLKEDISQRFEDILETTHARIRMQQGYPSYLERSIRKEKRAASIDTTSTTSIDTCDRATIDSSTRTLIDTNPRADMVATLLLHKDENEDLHDPEGHLCIAADQNIDGQGAAILEPSAATEDAKVLRQRTLGY
ncbi:hypothetical protein F2Q70_00038643 [Brassica cretica]|uniref:Uncharacterized protein n=1 Tax=Brassica cretica TaxID=69181 RepID=A0A8S9K6F5_BRACR|nr:hypothetical protein F2Q70_00038643 [Brassica cretica]